jgi:cellobiose-specific phosphotransferase system component IIB
MPDLKRGSTGSAVKKLQQYLDVEPANGNFGPVTETALKAWQAKNGLAETGIATPQIIARLATETINDDLISMQNKLAEDLEISLTGPVDDYAKYYEALAAGNYQELFEPSRLENNEMSNSTLLNETAEGSLESGLFDIDSAFAALAGAQSVQEPAAVVQTTTTNINNAQTTLNTANNTTSTLNQQIVKSNTEANTAINQTAANQSKVIQNTENLNATLTGPQISNIQNTTEQANALTNVLSTTSNRNQPQSNAIVENANTEVSRVENSQLITKSEVSQIVNPPNPVVGAVENMGTGVKREIQNMNTDISTNISNMKTGDNVSNSQVTQVDQSSIQNNISERTGQMESTNQNTNQPEPTASSNLQEMYLSAIYETLVGGIKVKLS